MSHELIVLVFIIVVALAFDFLNGFHDAANSIATVVSTRVLSPQKAVLWAAFFNFVAAFVLGTHVAKTMGQGMIDLSVVTQEVILAGLLGAVDDGGLGPPAGDVALDREDALLDVGLLGRQRLDVETGHGRAEGLGQVEQPEQEGGRDGRQRDADPVRPAPRTVVATRPPPW